MAEILILGENSYDNRNKAIKLLQYMGSDSKVISYDNYNLDDDFIKWLIMRLQKCDVVLVDLDNSHEENPEFTAIETMNIVCSRTIFVVGFGKNTLRQPKSLKHILYHTEPTIEDAIDYIVRYFAM